MICNLRTNVLLIANNWCDANFYFYDFYFTILESFFLPAWIIELNYRYSLVFLTVFIWTFSRLLIGHCALLTCYNTQIVVLASIVVEINESCQPLLGWWAIVP